MTVQSIKHTLFALFAAMLLAFGLAAPVSAEPVSVDRTVTSSHDAGVTDAWGSDSDDDDDTDDEWPPQR